MSHDTEVRLQHERAKKQRKARVRIERQRRKRRVDTAR